MTASDEAKSSEGGMGEPARELFNHCQRLSAERDRAVGALLCAAHDGCLTFDRARELLGMTTMQLRAEMARIFGGDDATLDDEILSFGADVAVAERAQRNVLVRIALENARSWLEHNLGGVDRHPIYAEIDAALALVGNAKGEG